MEVWMHTRRLGRNPQLQNAANNIALLSYGSTGSGVAEVQDMLASIGFKLPRSMKRSGADGKFGPETLAAVKEFQRQHGLKPDGIIGPKTIARFEQIIRERPFLEPPDPGLERAIAMHDTVAPVHQKKCVVT